MKPDRKDPTLRKSRLQSYAFAALCLCAAAPAARAADWNEIALAAAARAGGSAAYHLAALARMNVAVFETANYISARYRPRFVVASAGMQGVSTEAAAAAAAHDILVDAYPEQRKRLNRALRSALESIPGGAPRSSGVVLGRSHAAIVWGVAPAARWSAADADESPLWLARAAGRVIAARGLPFDQSARLKALSAIVLVQAHRIASERPALCGICIADAALKEILGESVLDRQSAAKASAAVGAAIARSALADYYPPRGEP